MEDFIHPEKLSHEIFFTNASRGQFKMMRWKTKRRGNTAYDGEGNQLSHKNWFPVFLAKVELESMGADLRRERKTWSEVMRQLT